MDLILSQTNHIKTQVTDLVADWLDFLLLYEREDLVHNFDPRTRRMTVMNFITGGMAPTDVIAKVQFAAALTIRDPDTIFSTFQHDNTLAPEVVDAMKRRAHDILGNLLNKDIVPDGMIAFFMQRAYDLISQYSADYKYNIMYAALTKCRDDAAIRVKELTEDVERLTADIASLDRNIKYIRELTDTLKKRYPEQ